MATNPIGPGTCNLSVNVPKAWRRFLGRRAFLLDVSMGELVRRMLAKVGFLFSATEAATVAENDDTQAAAEIRKAISDGLTKDDMPAIEHALKLIEHSATVDHQLAERLNLRDQLCQPAR